jgi:hypothetical protein
LKCKSLFFAEKNPLAQRRVIKTQLSALSFKRWMIRPEAGFHGSFVCCIRSQKSTLASSLRALSPFHEFLPGGVAEVRGMHARSAATENSTRMFENRVNIPFDVLIRAMLHQRIPR